MPFYPISTKPGSRTTIALMLVLSGALSFQACLEPTGPADPPLLQTDGAAYELTSLELTSISIGFETVIPYTFTNRTNGSVFIKNCNGGFALRLDRLVGEVWETVWSPVIGACLSLPIVIAENEVWSDTLRVFGGAPGCHCLPQFDVADPSGLYRLVWVSAFRSYDFHDASGHPLELRYRFSNTFTLTVR